MDKNNPYYKQVKLLISVLPYVAKEKCFALKGGTAINLFIQNFPRLSVDIDLAYMLLEQSELIRPPMINLTPLFGASQLWLGINSN